jgi:hypothetical protein
VPRPLKIDVLIEDRFDIGKGYHLDYLIPIWKAWGHDVRIVPLAEAGPPGDVGILHVNRTVLPDRLAAIVARRGRVVNGGALDMSKRRVSANLVRRGDGYGGPVIVKSNGNCAGASDMRKLERHDESTAWQRLRARLPWLRERRIPGGGYMVRPRPADVPRWVWGSADHVVERFRPERDGPFYRLRIAVVFGRQSFSRDLLGGEPVVKAGPALQKRYRDEPLPREVWDRVAALSVDFAKVDWVIHEGTPVVLDINPTPTRKSPPAGVEEIALFERLARGLYDIVGTVEAPTRQRA